MTLDISPTLEAKSDQINADELSQPITVQVVGVKAGASAEQPLDVQISGHKPWRPCKTMRRLLALAWGVDAGQWVGKWLVLYREPTVQWAGEDVGGIRIKAMSHIPKGGIHTKLQAKRGRRVEVSAGYYEPPASVVLTLDSVLTDGGVTMAALDGWRAKEGKPPVADLTDDQRRKLTSWLAADPARIDALRPFMPEPSPAREPGEGE